MKYIQAPNLYEKQRGEIAVFLAGGCGNRDWATTTIEYLQQQHLNHMVLYDPYNTNITNTMEQVQWEYNYLNNYINDLFIFSIYFDQYTYQPVSMYELGRALAFCNGVSVPLIRPDGKTYNVPIYEGFPTVITCHPNAPKLEDIQAQCHMINVECKIGDALQHAQDIKRIYKDIKHQMV